MAFSLGSIILTNGLGTLGEEANFLSGAMLIHTAFDMARATPNIMARAWGIYARDLGDSITKLFVEHEAMIG